MHTSQGHEATRKTATHGQFQFDWEIGGTVSGSGDFLIGFMSITYNHIKFLARISEDDNGRISIQLPWYMNRRVLLRSERTVHGGRAIRDDTTLLKWGEHSEGGFGRPYITITDPALESVMWHELNEWMCTERIALIERQKQKIEAQRDRIASPKAAIAS